MSSRMLNCRIERDTWSAPHLIYCPLMQHTPHMNHLWAHGGPSKRVW